MIYVAASVEVMRPREIVWAFLTDVSSIPEWVEGLVEAEVQGGGALQRGALIDVARSVRGRRQDATCEITALREPELLAVETRVPGGMLLDSARLSPTPHGTRIDVSSEILTRTTSSLATLFAPPTWVSGQSEPIRVLYERSLATLARRVEAFTARPYR